MFKRTSPYSPTIESMLRRLTLTNISLQSILSRNTNILKGDIDGLFSESMHDSIEQEYLHAVVEGRGQRGSVISDMLDFLPDKDNVEKLYLSLLPAPGTYKPGQDFKMVRNYLDGFFKYSKKENPFTNVHWKFTNSIEDLPVVSDITNCPSGLYKKSANSKELTDAIFVVNILRSTDQCKQVVAICADRTIRSFIYIPLERTWFEDFDNACLEPEVLLRHLKDSDTFAQLIPTEIVEDSDFIEIARRLTESFHGHLRHFQNKELVSDSTGFTLAMNPKSDPMYRINYVVDYRSDGSAIADHNVEIPYRSMSILQRNDFKKSVVFNLNKLAVEMRSQIVMRERAHIEKIYIECDLIQLLGFAYEISPPALFSTTDLIPDTLLDLQRYSNLLLENKIEIINEINGRLVALAFYRDSNGHLFFEDTGFWYGHTFDQLQRLKKFMGGDYNA